ncbi:MAG TPA: hypothetical protein PLX79_02235, partial [Candidatus Dojkabacteria bacterium]|nr:hypothetical protein [Candidatus Dojkabacteria bacterium]
MSYLEGYNPKQEPNPRQQDRELLAKDHPGEFIIGQNIVEDDIIFADEKQTKILIDNKYQFPGIYVTVTQHIYQQEVQGREIIINSRFPNNVHGAPRIALLVNSAKNDEREKVVNRTAGPITVLYLADGDSTIQTIAEKIEQLSQADKSISSISGVSRSDSGRYYYVIQDGKRVAFEYIPNDQKSRRAVIRLLFISDVGSKDNEVIEGNANTNEDEGSSSQEKFFYIETLPYRSPLEELWRKLLAKLQPRSEGDTDKDAAPSEILPQDTKSRAMLALITNVFKKIARAFTRTKEGKSDEGEDMEQPRTPSALKQIFKRLLKFFAQKREPEDAELKEGGENDIEGRMSTETHVTSTQEDRQDEQVNARDEGSKPIAEAIKQEETEPEMTYEQLAERVSNRISDLRNAIDRGQEVKSDELLELSAQLQQLTQVLAKELEKVEGEVDFEKDDFLNIEDSTNPQINKLIELYKSTLAKVFDHPGLKSRLAELNIFVLPTLDKDTIAANISAYGRDNNLIYNEKGLYVRNGSTLISFGSSSIRIYQYGNSRTAIIVAHEADLNDRSYSFISRVDNLYCSKNSQVFARYVGYADAIADQNDIPLILLKKVNEVGVRGAYIFRSDYKLPISPGQQTISATRLRTTKKNQGNVQISLSPGESFEITNVNPPSIFEAIKASPTIASVGTVFKNLSSRTAKMVTSAVKVVSQRSKTPAASNTSQQTTPQTQQELEMEGVWSSARSETDPNHEKVVSYQVSSVFRRLGGLGKALQPYLAAGLASLATTAPIIAIKLAASTMGLPILAALPGVAIGAISVLSVVKVIKAIQKNNLWETMKGLPAKDKVKAILSALAFPAFNIAIASAIPGGPLTSIGIGIFAPVISAMIKKVIDGKESVTLRNKERELLELYQQAGLKRLGLDTEHPDNQTIFTVMSPLPSLDENTAVEVQLSMPYSIKVARTDISDTNKDTFYTEDGIKVSRALVINSRKFLVALIAAENSEQSAEMREKLEKMGLISSTAATESDDSKISTDSSQEYQINPSADFSSISDDSIVPLDELTKYSETINISHDVLSRVGRIFAQQENIDILDAIKADEDLNHQVKQKLEEIRKIQAQRMLFMTMSAIVSAISSVATLGINATNIINRISGNINTDQADIQPVTNNANTPDTTQTLQSPPLVNGDSSPTATETQASILDSGGAATASPTSTLDSGISGEGVVPTNTATAFSSHTPTVQQNTPTHTATQQLQTIFPTATVGATPTQPTPTIAPSIPTLTAALHTPTNTPVPINTNTQTSTGSNTATPVITPTRVAPSTITPTHTQDASHTPDSPDITAAATQTPASQATTPSQVVTPDDTATQATNIVATATATPIATATTTVIDGGAGDTGGVGETGDTGTPDNLSGEFTGPESGKIDIDGDGLVGTPVEELLSALESDKSLTSNIVIAERNENGSQVSHVFFRDNDGDLTEICTGDELIAQINEMLTEQGENNIQVSNLHNIDQKGGLAGELSDGTSFTIDNGFVLRMVPTSDIPEGRSIYIGDIWPDALEHGFIGNQYLILGPTGGEHGNINLNIINELRARGYNLSDLSGKIDSFIDAVGYVLDTKAKNPSSVGFWSNGRILDDQVIKDALDHAGLVDKAEVIDLNPPAEEIPIDDNPPVEVIPPVGIPLPGTPEPPIPVQPTLTPVQPTLTPVQPTLTPIQPTLTPVQPTLTPIQPTLTPIQPTLTPEPITRPTDTATTPTPGPEIRPSIPTETPTVASPTAQPTNIATNTPVVLTSTPISPTPVATDEAVGTLPTATTQPTNIPTNVPDTATPVATTTLEPTDQIPTSTATPAPTDFGYPALTEQPEATSYPAPNGVIPDFPTITETPISTPTPAEIADDVERSRKILETTLKVLGIAVGATIATAIAWAAKSGKLRKNSESTASNDDSNKKSILDAVRGQLATIRVKATTSIKNLIEKGKKLITPPEEKLDSVSAARINGVEYYNEQRNQQKEDEDARTGEVEQRIDDQESEEPTDITAEQSEDKANARVDVVPEAVDVPEQAEVTSQTTAESGPGVLTLDQLKQNEPLFAILNKIFELKSDNEIKEAITMINALLFDFATIKGEDKNSVDNTIRREILARLINNFLVSNISYPSIVNGAETPMLDAEANGHEALTQALEEDSSFEDGIDPIGRARKRISQIDETIRQLVEEAIKLDSASGDSDSAIMKIIAGLAERKVLAYYISLEQKKAEEKDAKSEMPKQEAAVTGELKTEAQEPEAAPEPEPEAQALVQPVAQP